MVKYDFSNKVILITASSQGIGFGVAKAFHKAGGKVVINARNDLVLKKAEEELASMDASRVFSIVGDISKLDFLQSLVSHVEKHYNSNIDILVNNSGGPPAGAAINFTDQDWADAIDSNLLSVIRLTNLVIPGMKMKNWGRIINLTSTLAKEPANNMVLSNVTRAGVASFSKSMANEVGCFGITVNTILTGGCLTERFFSLAKNSIKGTDETLEQAVERMGNDKPVKFISTPEDFAQAILFLCSEESKYLTGISIPVDGGASRGIY